ncbi:MAG: DUF2917 domain-containing protein [Pseudobdellovibrionaceae bacterium]
MLNLWSKLAFWRVLENAEAYPRFEVQAKNIVFVMQPNETVSLNVPVHSTVTLTALAGVILVTIQGSLNDYRLRCGETLEVPSAGLLVFQSLTQNVPGKIQVSITHEKSH